MKRVLVTGANRGIGRAVAQQLAADGFAVTVHYRSGKEEAYEVLQAIESTGGTAAVLQFDVSDRVATRTALLDDVEKHGAYWGIVCNAGITRDNAFPALTESDWDDVIHTNLDGFYNVVQPLVMPMIQLRDSGRIVTISSVSGVAGNRGQVNYSASKAGLIGASKALALELAKRKITVNCVAPGLIGTDMVDERVSKEILGLIPMRRTGTTEEVAATVGFLFSQGAAYMTRQVLSVNGGLV